jgi:hypothetical protein
MRVLRRVSAIVLSAVFVLALGACNSSDAPAVKLDGSPRLPEIEGVVAKASAEGITVDGRTYLVSRKLLSFSTYNREAVALVSTVGSYVQAGVDGKTIEWLAKIGPVSADSDGHTTVQYQGDLVKVDGRRLIFKDGTVLRLAPGLTVPRSPLGPTYAVIDAAKHVIQGATFAPEKTTTTRT